MYILEGKVMREEVRQRITSEHPHIYLGTYVTYRVITIDSPFASMLLPPYCCIISLGLL